VTPLLDVNVLVALAWPNHVYHDLVRRWFADHHRSGWATCPLTESGFVRVSSNRSAIPAAVSPAEAVLLLRRLVALEGHRFWVDDLSIAATDLIDIAKLIAHRQVTDAHLVALALRHEGYLLTLDRRVAALPLQGQPDAVTCLLPTS
jgi:uncharacterized protein